MYYIVLLYDCSNMFSGKISSYLNALIVYLLSSKKTINF